MGEMYGGGGLGFFEKFTFSLNISDTQGPVGMGIGSHN
jgi:hypothetical protein